MANVERAIGKHFFSMCGPLAYQAVQNNVHFDKICCFQSSVVHTLFATRVVLFLHRSCSSARGSGSMHIGTRMRC